ncbi:unnamed protein product [Arabidopsis thaliana]|uniref:Reverse transcriptase zinc-binding domain-containing protein n=1 Tax=Arabidopsis thaliana TaxID=3702 RepID=A0A654FT54_ARATH|nr:unnamed protein product [Arabidopsis thaliana]
MLLFLRPLAEQFVKCNLGNGRIAHFWHDSWTSLGPLIKVMGDYGSRSLRIPLNARVVEALGVNGWKLPLSRFSSARTWDAIRPRAPELDWAKAVWFKGAVPKHAFNMWISQLDRLPTRQRLASWGHIQSFDCCLCTIETESRDHLLFSCEFAAQVWRLAFSRLCPRQRLFCSWAELLSWMRSSSTSAPSLLKKVSAHAIIYNIWRQRNNVLHNNLRIAPLIIFKIVDREIRNIISSRYHRKRWRNLMVLWIR